jgi:hypothetical protein
MRQGDQPGVAWEYSMAKQSKAVEQAGVATVANPVLSDAMAQAVNAQASEQAAQIIAQAAQAGAVTLQAPTTAPELPDVVNVDSAPVTLAEFVGRVVAFTATTVQIEAEHARTLSHLDNAFQALVSNAVEWFKGFHGAGVALETYTARRAMFDKALATAFKARETAGGKAIATESVNRTVRRILKAGEIERPESTAPKDIKAKLTRNAGAILGALHAGDSVALAKAVKKAGGDDSVLVAELRETHADAFHRVEVDGARRAALLEMMDGLADDSPTMARIYEAACL